MKICAAYSANEYLTRINLIKPLIFPTVTPVKHGQRVAVVGGGNVAMDAPGALSGWAPVRCILYRRSEAEMPARVEETPRKGRGYYIRIADQSGEIIGEDGWVKGLKCIRMELGQPDQSGRRRCSGEGLEFMDIDIVIWQLVPAPIR